MRRPRLEPRSLSSGPLGFSIVLRPQVTSWKDLVCLSKGLILQTFLTLETWRTRQFSPDGPPLIRKRTTCNNMLLLYLLFTDSIYPRKKVLLTSFLASCHGGEGSPAAHRLHLRGRVRLVAVPLPAQPLSRVGQGACSLRTGAVFWFFGIPSAQHRAWLVE